MTIVHPLFALAMTVIALLACMGLGRFRSEDLVPGRYRSIDGVRGYLALFVFIHHAAVSYYFIVYGKWQVPPSNLFTHLGESSVTLFFMITGFLFYGKLLDHRDRAIDWPTFFVARLLRLAPLYVAVVAVLMFLVFIESDGILVDSTRYVAKCVFQWLSFTISGAPAVNGVEVFSMIAGVNWSLPYELYFYLGMPLLALTRKIRVPWQVCLLSIVAMAYALTANLSIHFLAVFAAGIAAAFAVRIPCVRQFAQTTPASISILICLGMLVTFYATAYGYPQIVLLAVVFMLIAAGADLFGALSAKVSHVLGELSYSIYLLHGLLLYIGLKYVVGYAQVDNLSATSYWSIIGILCPILLLVASMAFRLVERPGMQSTKRIMAMLRAPGRPRNRSERTLPNRAERDVGG